MCKLEQALPALRGGVLEHFGADWLNAVPALNQPGRWGE